MASFICQFTLSLLIIVYHLNNSSTRRVGEVQRNRPNSSKMLDNNTKNSTIVTNSVGYAMLHQPYKMIKV